MYRMHFFMVFVKNIFIFTQSLQTIHTKLIMKVYIRFVRQIIDYKNHKGGVFTHEEECIRNFCFCTYVYNGFGRMRQQRTTRFK